MIRAVLFDLDGTLKFNRPNGVEAFVQFFRRIGLDVLRRRAAQRGTVDTFLLVWQTQRLSQDVR